MNKTFAGFVSALALPFLTPSAGAEGHDLRFSTGFNYASGDYGLKGETTTFAIPISFAVEIERITAFAEIPWVETEGPASAVLTSRPGLSIYAPRLAARFSDESVSEGYSASGLGDAMIGATFRLTPVDAPAWAGLTANVSVPTGDEEAGLGTGTSDVTFALNGETWIGNFAFMGGAGYVLLGENEDSVTSGEAILDGSDGFGFLSLGSRYDFASGPSLGLSVSWSQANYSNFEDRADVTASGSLPVSQALSAGIYVFAGVAGDGADAGGGLSLTFHSQP